jgi:hypothetical protein
MLLGICHEWVPRAIGKMSEKPGFLCTARSFVGHTRLWLKEKEREIVYIYIYCKCIAYILEVMRLD